MRAAQFAIASPLTALTWAVAGPDLAVIGLIVLAGALLVPTGGGGRHTVAASTRSATVWSAAVLAAVVSMKLTALPALVVLAFVVFATRGGRALRPSFVSTFLSGMPCCEHTGAVGRPVSVHRACDPLPGGAR